ncbi:hypothetical protein [Actinokineospora enzanensis]|uniref:hypothetical protein n=1 Tax=Actinokineospora enzanensis TaxID=155975 RepID=UPI0003733068|nr:hypothetical protein [Actinokineospora enzanensis]
MARRLVAVPATAAALIIGLAGCGGSDSKAGGTTGSTPPPAATTTAAPATTTADGGAGASDGATAWAEKVCSTVAPEVAKLAAKPNIDPSNPAVAKQGLVDYFGTMATAMDKMITGIKDAGAPPVPDGAKLAEQTTQGLQKFKTASENAKAAMAKASVTDPAAFQQVFTQIAEEMQNAEMEDPTSVLRGDTELDKAFKAAPTCKMLDDAGNASGGAQATPTP